MFLVEDSRKAVLYTGDIRDRIYLDTTFAINEDPYRSFPTKAQGISELLKEVSRWPENTIFHFNAWTLGYEDVWLALAAHLKSQIHVDDYKLRLYTSMNSSSVPNLASTEGAALCGFLFGNHIQAGCLTNNASVRLHSCERGSKCNTLEQSRSVVWITPLVNRSEDGDFPEIGAGGGGGDLSRTHELDLTDSHAVKELMKLCENQIGDDQSLTATLSLVAEASLSLRQTLSLNVYDPSFTENAIPIGNLARLLHDTAKQQVSLDQPERIPLVTLSQRNSTAIGAGKGNNPGPLPRNLVQRNKSRWGYAN
ncbi:MAG: hypothetical protein Q9220_005592 [cf. Caloplaca sp. 1 TL-2023]